MRRIFIILFLFTVTLPAVAQNGSPDSLVILFNTAINDSARCREAQNLYNYYEELNRDSALFYADQSLQLSRKNDKRINVVTSLCQKAYQEMNMGRFSAALKGLLTSLQIAEDPATEMHYWVLDTLVTPHRRRLYGLSYSHHMLGILMWRTQNIEEEILHFKKAKSIGIEASSPLRVFLANMNLGRSYASIQQLDSALLFEKEAEELVLRTKYTKYYSFILYQQGVIYLRLGDLSRARSYLYAGTYWGINRNNISALARAYNELTKIHLAEGQLDSSLYYGKKTEAALVTLGALSGTELNIGVVFDNIGKIYTLQNEKDSAIKYQQLALVVKDSLYTSRIKSLADFQNLSLQEQMRLQVLEKEKTAYQNRIRTYFLLAGIGVLLLLALIFFRNNRQKLKANKKIEKAYADLKSTQSQLVHAEKMASLGELTAGIAHEIQNPLNFVNNFSEINSELISELIQEIDNGNTDEAKTIASGIDENEQKIMFHGKRADAIVKGMLQHSRSSNGQKEATNINALADEYLRLAYHGLRAKDKSFNASIKTDFDAKIGDINVIPQDFGRVILNLITNAFYAVTQRKKMQEDGYEPAVQLSTRKRNGKIEVSIKDNGTGIPAQVRDKIFQPFFTTKPTGEGTGLGLSLSYDIITKGHGGELNVITDEVNGTEFIIIIPS